jgi:hypothetical protein
VRRSSGPAGGSSARTDCTQKPMLAHGEVLAGGRWWAVNMAGLVIRWSTALAVVGSIWSLRLCLRARERSGARTASLSDMRSWDAGGAIIGHARGSSVQGDCTKKTMFKSD